VLTTSLAVTRRRPHLTTREKNKLTATQAQTIIAAAILRQLHAVVVHRQAWDPALATGTTKTQGPLVAA
jgi:transposase